MTIATLDGLLAGMQPTQHIFKNYSSNNRFLSSWSMVGVPTAGSYNSTLNGGTYSSTGGLVTGQIPHTDPAGGLSAYLARLYVGVDVPNSGMPVILCDRLWDNGGIDVTNTGVQSIVSPTWPLRDANGATAGAGVLLAVDVSAATGAGTPTITVGYTNSAGTASRTATNILATVASTAVNTTNFIGLQSGDVGVRSVQSIQLSATWTSGTINLVAYRPLACLGSTSVGASIDCITGGFPRLYNGVVPFLIFFSGASGASDLVATYTESAG